METVFTTIYNVFGISYNLLMYYICPKTVEYYTVSVVTDNGTYKRLLSADSMHDSRHTSINTAVYTSDWELNDITIVNETGSEDSYFQLLRPYFGPEGNYWVNTIQGLESVLGEKIKFVTVFLKNTKTQDLKVIEFNEQSPIFIGVLNF